VLFTTQTQLLGSRNAARATATFERRFQTLARVAVLIIDDFGLKPLRTPQDEDFHDLIAEGYEQAATIVTSNLDFAERGDAFFPTDSSALPPWLAYAMPRIELFSRGIHTAHLAPWIHHRK
jgi:DNA replication protein DnaC